MVNTAKLPSLLKQLRLKTIGSTWENTALDADASHWTYPQYLTVLCDKEMVARTQSRIQRLMLEAKLPLGKTLDTFEFEKLASLNPAQISAFAENPQWLSSAQNLIIFGPSGVGKTHIAAAIGRRLIQHGMKVLFFKTTMLVEKLQTAYASHKLSDLLIKLNTYDLLILDDIGVFSQ